MIFVSSLPILTRGSRADLSFLQWLVMPYNLIFMGMHFVISKRKCFFSAQLLSNTFVPPVYANSLLATCVPRFLSHSLLTQIVIFYSLNSRRLIQQEHETHKRGPSGDLPVAFPGYANRNGSKFAVRDPRMSPTSPNSLTRPLPNQPRLDPMGTQVRELTSSAPAGA